MCTRKQSKTVFIVLGILFLAGISFIYLRNNYGSTDTHLGLPLGSETEEFFDQTIEDLQKQPTSGPMRGDTLQDHEADQVRRALANELILGDLEAAQKRFTPTEKNLIIQDLDQTSLAKLGNAIKNASLAKEEETYRVYETIWLDETGDELPLEFIMSQNDSGNWIIISW